MKIGLDVGSTTIKCVVLNDNEEIVYQSYERHFSQIIPKMLELLSKIKKEIVGDQPAEVSVSGSAGMGVAQSCELPLCLYRKDKHK